MTKIVAAHQPNYLPYWGFFDKMRAVDELGNHSGIFVIRDDVQYVADDFHRRNRIRTNGKDGFVWLTIPVRRSDKLRQDIFEVEINHESRISNQLWSKYHPRQIYANYKKTAHFDEFFYGLETIYSKADGCGKLANFNIEIIRYLAECFGIKTKILSFKEEIPENIIGDNPSQTLANMTQYLDANVYLSGSGGKNYLDLRHFEGLGVDVVFQEASHPVYPQRFPGFKPDMSAIDVLFNVGHLPRSGERL